MHRTKSPTFNNKKPDNPDYLIIDLDPSDKNNFDRVIETAPAFKKLFDKAGAKSFCKTSGSTGLHIYVPMKKKYDYETIKNFANIVCEMLNEMLPDFTKRIRNLKKRGDEKIYLDSPESAWPNHQFCVFFTSEKWCDSIHALSRQEVKKGLRTSQFTLFNALARVKKSPRLFDGVVAAGTDIPACLKKLAV